ETTPSPLDPLALSRCVRGDPFEQGFVAQHGGSTSLDAKTGLEWQRDISDVAPMRWADALAYCEKLRLAGACDWRLPSVKELLTIVDGDAFPDAPPEPHLTSTIVAASGDAETWFVHFGTGAVARFTDDVERRVRCVR